LSPHNSGGAAGLFGRCLVELADSSTVTVEEHRDGSVTVRIHADSGDVIERDARMPGDKALAYIERLEGAGLPKKYWSH